MSAQATLWDPLTKARRDDPETSKDAGASAEPVARHHHRLILAALTLKGDAIYTDLAAITNLPPVAVNRRLAELRRAGLVERLDGGTEDNPRPKVTRATPSGRQAFCYRRVT